VRIKDLPEAERPREKALRYGIASLSNIEILALVIGSGVRDQSALDIAAHLIAEAKGIHHIENCSLERIEKIRGIKKISALRLAAVFELLKRVEKTRLECVSEPVHPKAIFEKYKLEFARETQEQFALLFLSRRRMITGEKIMYKGTAEYFPIAIGEILSELLANKCFAFIVVHNHPSGETQPSDDDLISTKMLASEAARLKIKLVDHIIISDRSYFSFAEHNLIK